MMTWEDYLDRLDAGLDSIRPSLLSALVGSLLAAHERGQTIFTCGNGGSASTASHLAQDLAKGTLVEGVAAFRTECLADNVSGLTAWANDEGYEHVFAAPLRAKGDEGDVLIAISGSGNSPNVLRAVEVAHDLGMRTWGVCGFDGGKLLHLAQRTIHVSCHDMGMVEAVHGVVFHWLVDRLRLELEGLAQRLSIMDAPAPEGRASW